MRKDMDFERYSFSESSSRNNNNNQDYLNPSSSTEAQLLSGEEILRFHVKQLLTGNSGVLSETVAHSAASDRTGLPRKRKIMSTRTEHVKVCIGSSQEVPLDDGYCWRKNGQTDILGSKYPRGYYRCTHRHSQGCLATKQVQRSDDDPKIFEVIYRGRHTCKQSSNLAAAVAAAPPLEAESKEKPEQLEEVGLSFRTRLKVKTRTEHVKVCIGSSQEVPLDDGYCWRKYVQKDIPGSKYPRGYYRCTHRHSQGCLATKQVQRWDDDPKSFEVTYRGRHTCKQSSNLAAAVAAAPPMEAESKEKPKQLEEVGLSFRSRLKVKTEELEKEEIFPSFPFPYSSNELEQGGSHIFPESMLENDIMGSISHEFLSPVSSESNYSSMSPSHMGSFRVTGVHFDDGYSWRQYEQKDIQGFKYPREYYRCSQSNYPGSRCAATKLVQRSDDDPTILEITYLGRHTCEQPSHLPPLIEAESEEKPEKSKMIIFEWILVVANFILELPSAVFDQLSSVPKPLYALVLMLLSFAALVLCIVELAYQGRKKRVTWIRGDNNCNSFSNVSDIVGFTCAVCQSLLTTANYVLLIQHTKIQIQISVWPLIFAFVLLCSKICDKTDRSERERDHNEA